jgi:hypothetical protein
MRRRKRVARRLAGRDVVVIVDGVLRLRASPGMLHGAVSTK